MFNRFALVVFSLVLALSLPAAANAATVTFDYGGIDDNWSNSANWDTDMVPTSADDVIIPATYDVDVTTNASANTVSVLGSLNLSAGVVLSLANTYDASPDLTLDSPNASIVVMGGVF